MITITCLPVDVIEIILGYKCISLENVVSLRSTCKILQQITLSNTFWKQKYYQRYPAKIMCDAEKKEKSFWHIEAAIKNIKTLQCYVSLMSDNKLYDTKRTKLRDFLQSIVKNFMIYRFVMDELNIIISAESAWQDGSNWSNGYNFGLIFHWLRQYRFIYKQNKFTKLPRENLLLEKQLTIMAQYFRPHVSYSVINKWLDDVTQEVLVHLRKEYPMHSIFSAPLEVFPFLRDNNIKYNFWNKTEAKQIMFLLQEFIFSDSRDHKLYQLLKTLYQEIDDLSSLTDNLYRRINEYQRIIIYYIVARRLGVCCILECWNNKLQILWKPKYNIKGKRNTEVFSVTYEEDHLYSITRKQIYDDSQPNSLNDLTCLLHMLNCFDFCELNRNDEHQCWKIHILYNILNQSLESIIKQYADIECENEDITESIKIRSNIIRKVRPEERKNKKNRRIKFAVGMIVSHDSKAYLSYYGNKTFHYGVIIGWHFYCKADDVRKDLYSIAPHLSECCTKYGCQQICLCLCKKSDRAKNYLKYTPHYIILVECNMICYVPERIISPCHYDPERASCIDNVEIGRYFSKFEGTYYIPNKILAKDYPDDTAVILRKFSYLQT